MSHSRTPHPRPRATARARTFGLVALTVAGAFVASIANAQEVRYTVEVFGANEQVFPLDSFRSGDPLNLRIGVHNATDRALEPGSVWIVLPPAEGIRAPTFTAAEGYTDPTRYEDADGRVSNELGRDLTAFYPAFEEPLSPGANHHVRIRLIVTQHANDLPALVDALHVYNRFDRTIGTRVDELPPADAAATESEAAPERSAPIGAHVTDMFGHVGAVRHTCPDLEPVFGADIGSDETLTTICGEVEGSFRDLQRAWDRYFDSPSDTLVTASAMDAWARDENELYTRLFAIDGEPFMVTYHRTDDNTGVVVVVLFN